MAPPFPFYPPCSPLLIFAPQPSNPHFSVLPSFAFFISFLFPSYLTSPLLCLHYLPYIRSPPSSPHLIPCCTPLPPSSQSALLFQALVHLIHSLVHPFIYSREPSFISLFSRHSFTGWPARRGFIAGQLRHLRFQSSPAECLPPRFLTRLFTP